MQKVEDKTLQLFLDRFIEELKIENEKREVEREKKIDIPFILSSLYQSFKNDASEHCQFIKDLNTYSDYNVIIFNSYNGIIDVDIKLVKFIDTNDFYDYDLPNYNYKLCFTYDDRPFGFCDCTPDMPDYREDKQCCGHGCDAVFCDFSIYKVSRIVSGSWKGDEHDYWEFEDEFYMSEKDLAEKKEKEERKIMIKELRNRIEKDQKRLAELESM